jgi:L-ascorbate metabolism protein UlaG (beta-lactamase superfamily)
VIEPMLSDERLSKDIEHHSRHVALGRVSLWWLGQSGYLMQRDGTRVLIDPYLSDALTLKYANTDKPHVRMSRRVIDPAKLPRVDVITSSHNHTDHLDAATILPVLATSPAATIVVPEANRAFAAERLGLPTDRLCGMDDGQCLRASGLEIFAVPAAHPQFDRDDADRHRCLGYVFRVGGWTVYHSGDTIAYDGQVERLLPFKIDVAILPINGKVGNMDGESAARLGKAIGARVVIPCHYNMFEFNTASPVGFEHAARSLGVRTRVLELGERFDSRELAS